MKKSNAFVRPAEAVPPVPCPCGEAARIVTGADNDLVSIHRVAIRGEAVKHYHKKLMEHYVILEGAGVIELDETAHEVKPGDVVCIPPGTQHALRGHFTILNIVTPPFDPDDEFRVE